MTSERFISEDWPKPTWLVEGIWSKGAFGWWAGEYKAYKTWTVLDLAVAVASGRPFLGRYAVSEVGPVMYVHDEGRQGEVARHLWRVKVARGLVPNGNGSTSLLRDPLPLYVCSFPHLDLTVEDDRDAIVNTIRRYNLKVLILEAWYLMSGSANENHADETTPMVKWLMQVAVNEGCAIIVSHHYNKGSGQGGGKGARPGTRMSGTGVFGRVYESAVYLSRVGEDSDNAVKITAHHRAHPGEVDDVLRFVVDPDVDEDYNVQFLTNEEVMELEGSMVGGVEVNLEDAKGERPVGRPVKSLAALSRLGEGETIKLSEAAEMVKVSKETLKRRLGEGVEGREARLVRRGTDWWVVGLGDGS